MDHSLLDSQHQADNDALASAVGAAARHLGLDADLDVGDVGDVGMGDLDAQLALGMGGSGTGVGAGAGNGNGNGTGSASTNGGMGAGVGVGVGADTGTEQGDQDTLSHDHTHPNPFVHHLQQPDFSTHSSHKNSPDLGTTDDVGVGVGVGVGADIDLSEGLNVEGEGGVGVGVGVGEVDVSALDIPLEVHEVHDQHQHQHQHQIQHQHQHVQHQPHQPQHDSDLDLGLSIEEESAPAFSRPPSIRKACDLCHAAKQKCSGDRPTCTRCAAGGWHCHYAPRQRRRTVPKEQRQMLMQQQAEENGRQREAAAKKRKLDARRNSLTFENGLDLKTAMGMAMDMGLGQEDDGEEIHEMSTEAMLEVIAVDGFIADLPLRTFVANLPYTAPAHEQATQPEHDFVADAFQAADMDQHTTSALRDAIFSLNESSGHHVGGDEGDVMGDGDVNEGMDPHLALLDLSHLQDGDGEGEGDEGTAPNDIPLHDLGEDAHDILNLNLGCNHPVMVPHLLYLLAHHSLDPKPNSNTPLTMGVLAPLARSIRTFHNVAQCPSCCSSPAQTLPQLALISRVATVLTFPFPPINSGTIPGAQIVIHGARLTGTGISDSIEQHIVNVIWDSWRASIREIFMVFERQARDVIAASGAMGEREEEDELKQGEGAGEGAGGNGAGAENGSGTGTGNGRGNGTGSGARNKAPTVTAVETQRAGLFFQAMSRLKQAMEEVESE